VFDVKRDVFEPLKKKREMKEMPENLLLLMKRDIMFLRSQTTDENSEMFNRGLEIPEEYKDKFKLHCFSIPQCYCVLEYWNNKTTWFYYPNIPGSTHCSNCGKKLSGMNDFNIFDLRQQLSVIFSRKENREALFNDQEEMFKKSQEYNRIFNQSPNRADNFLFSENTTLSGYRSGLISQSYVKFGLYNQQKYLPLELALFVDGYAVQNKGANRTAMSVTGFILNLPDKLRYSEENLVDLASFNENNRASTSAFIPLIDYLNFLSNEGATFDYLDEDGTIESVFFKPIVSIVIIDKESAGWMLGIKKHSGMESCFTCLIHGKYECKHTYFQRKVHSTKNVEIDDRYSSRRTDKVSRIAFELNHFLAKNKRVLGVKEYDFWDLLAGKDHNSRVINDPFHTHAVNGVGPRMVKLLPFENRKKPLIDLIKTDYLSNMKLPSHIFSHSNDWKSKQMTGTAWSNAIRYTSVPLFIANKVKPGFISLWSEYASNYGKLASKTSHLKVRELMDIQKSNIQLTTKLEPFFGVRLYFPKMHVASEHTAPDTLRVGKLHIASSASGESALGNLKKHGRFSQRNMVCSIHNYIAYNHRLEFSSLIFDYLLKKNSDLFFKNEKISNPLTFVLEHLGRNDEPLFKKQETMEVVVINRKPFHSKRILDLENKETNNQIVVKIYDYNKGQNTLDCFFELQDESIGLLRAIDPLSLTCYYNPGEKIGVRYGNIFEYEFDHSKISEISHKEIKRPVVCFPKDPSKEEYENVLIYLPY